jgi:hypothetical protein
MSLPTILSGITWTNVVSLISALAAMVAAIAAVRGVFKSSALHVLINSRMTELLGLRGAASFSAGRRAGIEAQQDRTDAQDVRADARAATLKKIK